MLFSYSLHNKNINVFIILPVIIANFAVCQTTVLLRVTDGIQPVLCNHVIHLGSKQNQVGTSFSKLASAKAPFFEIPVSRRGKTKDRKTEANQE